jgi:hydroxyethylthiazole kinase-like sugar kinase family protein/thiamine monophosphate synthase
MDDRRTKPDAQGTTLTGHGVVEPGEVHAGEGAEVRSPASPALRVPDASHHGNDDARARVDETTDYEVIDHEQRAVVPMDRVDDDRGQEEETGRAPSPQAASSGEAKSSWRPSAAQAWRRIRDSRPTVLIAGTDPGGVADALASLGARPVQAQSSDEASALLSSCGAVVIDAASTLTGRWGQPFASARARAGAPPVVLVATLVDRSPLRRNEARRLVAEARPAVIRGSVAELAALVGLTEMPGSGHAGAASVAQVVASRTGAVAIAWTEDMVATSDARTMRSGALLGTPAQVRVASRALDAAVAATLACGSDALAGVRAAVVLVDAAVRSAADHGRGVGTFSTEILDTLAGADERGLEADRDDPADAPRRELSAHLPHEPSAYPDGEAWTSRGSQPGVTFSSIVDDVANRFEGGRVVPGSVPVHLLRDTGLDGQPPRPDRWARVSLIDLRAVPDRDPVPASPEADPVAVAVLGAANMGATAVVADVDAIDDASALARLRRVVEVATAKSIAVAVLRRVDLAVACGASAVWLVKADGSVPVDAAVNVASQRVAVIAQVATESEAREAFAYGADVITGHGRTDPDLVAIANALGVEYASLIAAGDELSDGGEASGVTGRSPETVVAACD